MKASPEGVSAAPSNSGHPTNLTSRSRGPRNSFLPFSRPTIEEDEIAEVVDSLQSGWITSGPKVVRFEEMFSKYFDGAEAVAVNSATAGLHIVLHALGIGAGDEVIVPSITWPSTANVVELLGAKAVFADVDSSTLQIDPAEIPRLATSRTRAVVPVHYAGAPADIDEIRRLAAQRNLSVIEDAAHAVGTGYRGRQIGSDSFAAVFSFHPIKNITTGEGGMIVCRDSELARRLRLLRFHGTSKDAWRRFQGRGPQYEVLEPGYKYNMLDLQAALGLHQFPKLQRFNSERRRLAAWYGEALASIPEILPIGLVPYPADHAWHLYVVRLKSGGLTVDRDKFIDGLSQENIGAGLHFSALHLHPYYRDRYHYHDGDLPRAEAAGASILSLPLYPTLTHEDQQDVVDALARVIARHRRAD
ncbi:MAG TPA: aminotransferase class I/II-fold pyridoxal phosphate-dependent enzyme [Candidatus Angelobacter sp.]|nr:aminotransferase class I/II-fold pyridoxal phosphate-dependent enzyme [Candidatus Angelobacter sp.]